MIITQKVVVTYKKTFLNGNLAGLTVQAEVPWSSLQCAEYFVENIAEMTAENPGVDACTLSRFFVTDITIEARVQGH